MITKRRPLVLRLIAGLERAMRSSAELSKEEGYIPDRARWFAGQMANCLFVTREFTDEQEIEFWIHFAVWSYRRIKLLRSTTYGKDATIKN